MFLDLSYGNSIVMSQIVLILNPDTNPQQRLYRKLKEEKKIIDLTNNQKMRSLIILKSGKMVVSSVKSTMLKERFDETSKSFNLPGLFELGFGNYVPYSMVDTITTTDSAQLKRIVDMSKKLNQMFDVKHGRKTRSLIILINDFTVLSAIDPKTIKNKFLKKEAV